MEEGVLINNFKLVDRGTYREAESAEVLTGPNIARNPEQNIADLRANAAMKKVFANFTKWLDNTGWIR